MGRQYSVPIASAPEKNVCDGTIDYVIHGNPVYRVTGWMVHSIKQKLAADEIISIISYDNVNELLYYHRVNTLFSPDISKKYKSANFDSSRFQAFLTRDNRYALGYIRDNFAYECENFKPLQVSGERLSETIRNLQASPSAAARNADTGL